jgi:hypothetical protein
MATVQIKHRHTDAVLFTHETTEERQASGLAMRDALEAATKARANLAGANLAGANLDGAYLARAYLARANLDSANLAGANLAGANLDGAYLARAYLAGANLAGAYLARANLAGADLAGANLAGANLAGAYLAGANLDGAYLARANLDGAKWRENITINRAPLQIAGLHWMVYILDQHMQIGCQLHTIAEWRDFDDAAIVDMDGKSALRFWRAHKSALLALAESDGRGVALSEIAESA